MVLVLSAFDVKAGVYKWTDAQGQVHYSDRPVPGNSIEMSVNSPPASPSTSEDPQKRREKMQRMLDVYEEDRAKQKHNRKQQQAAQKKRQQNCLLAKDRYKSHHRAVGIYHFDKAGKRRYLEDRERQQHMKKLRANIDRWCH
jgi:hypothetical protein